MGQSTQSPLHRPAMGPEVLDLKVSPSLSSPASTSSITTKDLSNGSIDIKGHCKLNMAIRCTLPNCRCDCYTPGGTYIRICDTCKHGWVAHALDKLGPRNVHQLGMQVEVVQPNIVFDIASLVLYGAQATPIRLKILLDRLFSVLQHDEVLQVLHGFGWSYEDYARGYILQVSGTQDPSGRVLDKWAVASREEETLILQQFLRFGETRSIAQEIILTDTKELQEKLSVQTPKTESEIKKFIERSNVAMQSLIRAYDARHFYAARFAPYPFVSSPGSIGAPRIVSPSVIHAYSPPVSTREVTSVESASNASPSSASPLNRLQTMQPVDYRRDHTTPAMSPASSDISATSQASDATSPQNLSLSAPKTSTPIPHHESVIQAKQEKLDDYKYGEPPVYVKVPSTPPMMEEALDFSTKDSNKQSCGVSALPRVPQMPSEPQPPPYESKMRHTRKATNPIKRQWQPSGAFGSTFVSPSGKKRVLCTACNKTFCDKGALKIHYSAVHLKEMHKCTVEGCKMVFSSRRSRNRHSANPNPKLHMPQNRRKLPDGARIIDDGKPATATIGSLLSTPQPRSLSQLDLTPPSSKSAIATHSEGLDVSGLSRHSTPPADFGHGELGHGDLGHGDLGHVPPPAPEQRYFLQPARDPDELGQVSPPPMCSSIDNESASASPASQSPAENKMEQSSGSGRRKRKSLVPTRCAQLEEVFTMSDEGSNDATPTQVKSEQGDMDQELIEEGESCAIDPFLGDSSGQPREPGGTSFLQDSSSKASTEVYHSDDSCEGPQDLTIDSKRNGDNLSQAGTPTSPSSKSFLGPDLGRSKAHDHNDNLDDLDNGSMSDSPVYSDDNTDHKMAICSNGFDIPIDNENPRRCPACGKLFQNHFSVKTHYQNVHLKLMHTCTIEGCNAAFPSKRSRDRHSTNLNLHRKLLSTSNDSRSMPSSLISQSLRAEFLPKIYDAQSLPPNGVMRHEQTPDHDSGTMEDDSDSSMVLDESNTTYNNDAKCESPIDGLHEEDLRQSADSGKNSMVECHICQDLFRDNLVLKEHFELVHPKETYRCTIYGCDKIFSTRKSRNRHSQNESLHKHLGPGQINGVC